MSKKHKINPKTKKDFAGKTKKMPPKTKPQIEVKLFDMKNYLIFALITGSIFVTYFKAFFFEFSPLDDDALIVTQIDKLQDFSNIKAIFSNTVFNEGSSSLFYRPLLMVSFMIDASLGGGEPFMFHFTNIFLHIITSSLLFWLFISFNFNKSLAVFLTFIFALNPLQLHTVAWLPGRNDSLLAIFVLSSLVFFVKHIQTKKIYFLILYSISFIFALFTKENAIALPVLTVMVYYLLLNKKDFRPFIPYAFIWGAVLITWFWIRSGIVNTFSEVKFSEIFSIIGQMITAHLIYLGKFFVPVFQALMPITTDTPVWVGIFVFVILCGMCYFVKLKNTKIFVLGILTFLMFISLPILHAATTTGEHYENRLYIPAIGLLLMISQIDLKKTIKKKQPLFKGLAIAVFIIFSAKTFVRSDVYKNQRNFAEAVVKESPSLSRAWNIKGNIHFDEKQYKQAIKCYRKGLSISKNYIKPYQNLAMAYDETGNSDSALYFYDIALQVDTAEAMAYYNRGIIHKKRKNYDKAIADFDMTIKYAPTYVAAYNNKANIYFEQKQHAKAIKIYTKAIEINPQFANLFYNRAANYFVTRQFDAALKDALKAQELGYNVDEKFIKIIKLNIAKKE